MLVTKLPKCLWLYSNFSLVLVFLEVHDVYCNMIELENQAVVAFYLEIYEDIYEGLGFAILLAPACLAYLWNAQNHNKHVCTQYFSFRGDQLDIQMLQSVTI